MKHVICIIVLGITLALTGVACAGVNGDIHVSAGQTADHLKTVNGDIRIDEGARVADAKTVNGTITMGENADAGKLKTVNGDITLSAHAKITHTVEAVNGALELHVGADVGGRVSNINGDITLDAAHVGGGLETANGNINIGANSRVEGGIVVDKSSNDRDAEDKQMPRIVIGPGAVVRGTLDFRRKVDLYVSDSAQVGPIKGATAHTFSGAQP